MLSTINQKPITTALLLYILALVCRLTFIHLTVDSPVYDILIPALDPDMYWRAAVLINQPLADTPNFELIAVTSRFFAYFIAGFQWVFGESILSYRVFAACIASFCTPLMYQLSLNCGLSRKVAVIAALFVCLYPNAWHFDTTIAKSNLEILVFLIIGLLLTRIYKTTVRPSLIMLAFVTGVLLAVCIAIQPVSLILLGGALVFLMQLPGKSRKMRMLLAGVLVSVSSLFVILNWQLMDRSPEKRPLFGFVMHLSFNENATGLYQAIPNVPGNLFGHSFYPRLVAELELEKQVSPAEGDRFFFDKFFTFLKEKPGQLAILIVRKVDLFFNAEENRGEEYLPLLKAQNRMLRWNPLSTGILLVLFPFGIYSFIRRRSQLALWITGLLTINTCALCIVLMPMWRYRYPLIIPLALCGAAGLNFIWETLRVPRQQLNWRKLAVFAVILTCVSMIVFRPVHSQAYLKSVMEVAVANDDLAVRKKENLLKIVDFRQKNDNWEFDPSLINVYCNLHYYTYCYYLTKNYIGRGYLKVDVTRWYIDFLVYQGNYDAARDLLRKLRLYDPDGFESIVNSKHSASASALAVKWIWKEQ